MKQGNLHKREKSSQAWSHHNKSVIYSDLYYRFHYTDIIKLVIPIHYRITLGKLCISTHCNYSVKFCKDKAEMLKVYKMASSFPHWVEVNHV